MAGLDQLRVRIVQFIFNCLLFFLFLFVLNAQGERERVGMPNKYFAIENKQFYSEDLKMPKENI